MFGCHEHHSYKSKFDFLVGGWCVSHTNYNEKEICIISKSWMVFSLFYFYFVLMNGLGEEKKCVRFVLVASFRIVLRLRFGGVQNRTLLDYNFTATQNTAIGCRRIAILLAA